MGVLKPMFRSKCFLNDIFTKNICAITNKSDFNRKKDILQIKPFFVLNQILIPLPILRQCRKWSVNKHELFFFAADETKMRSTILNTNYKQNTNANWNMTSRKCVRANGNKHFSGSFVIKVSTFGYLPYGVCYFGGTHVLFVHPFVTDSNTTADKCFH